SPAGERVEIVRDDPDAVVPRRLAAVAFGAKRAAATRFHVRRRWLDVRKSPAFPTLLPCHRGLRARYRQSGWPLRWLAAPLPEKPVGEHGKAVEPAPAQVLAGAGQEQSPL